MGTLFRSQEMTLCQLFIQSEATYSCVSELGELGLVQFRDMNESTSGFQRKFVTEIRRCDEMDRKLRFLEKEISRDKTLKIQDDNENPEAPQPRQMIEMEAAFDKLETELRQVNLNSEALRKSFLELTELKHLLQKTQQFFDEGNVGTSDTNVLLEQAVAGQPRASSLSFVAGVIPCERMQAFELMLWRACRGNVFLRRSEIEDLLDDPSTDDPVHKFAFVVFYQGEQLKSRISKICEAFRASVYPCPDTPAERREMLVGVMARLHDLNTVLKQTDDHRHRVLQAAAQNLRVWLIRVGKIKAIYMTLNLFNIDVTQKFMIGEAWCPVDGLESIRSALNRGAERTGAGVQAILNRVATAEQPPTYNKVNRFTESFQNLVDAYGSGAYQEVNPAPFVIITFPFLFGVMFGDLGHGLLMFCFAMFLVLKERSLAATTGYNEIWATIFGGRYIILLMSIFSMYTGFLYNDIFAKSMNFFGTGWHYPNGSWMPETGSVQLNSNDSNQWSGAAYPFGVDPVWQLAGNKITFTNSLKMKMSIILGVVHMSVGVVLSVYNHTFFRRRLSIFFEWIPQVLFLEFIFGYLVILIIYKWCVFTPDTSGTAPSLLIGLINMFMFKYAETDVLVYNGQQGVQTFLVLVAIFCIPVMLAVKPIITICSQSSHHHHHHDEQQTGIENPLAAENKLEGTSNETSDVEAGTSSSAAEQPSDEHHGDSTSDIVVHQAIHTIEFCLGCISNTASYLRLWALSLAHAQLSEVLWTMVMQIGLSVTSPFLGAIMIYVVFIPFSVLTVGILLVMEGLSAFLHALRLHWVEFMNKFYAGTGYLFEPFSFAAVLDVRISQD